MNLPPKKLVIGPHTVCLSWNENLPVVKYQNRIYPHIWLLVEALPELSDPLHLVSFAQLSNFLWKGGEFEYIECIKTYQNSYKERIGLERAQPTIFFEHRLTDYKIFDVSIMHKPKIESNQLVYFAYQVSTGLPYRVVCPFPYKSTTATIHYQILPIIE
ncbi:hypothetical protein [Candidatus Protochlamydia amoebophila]|uniref:Uncharacterized protein n=2 Tax=Candidatus Protochlamydia amoebophila TaxID=362787 RepID=Q6MEH3_PARUW|nr:hypothetical protein [Candidatus Protochlamydia amoebophila]CAF23026.1 unnamed protein product [Candidatus Protochlamydia amoebophila UWE25]